MKGDYDKLADKLNVWLIEQMHNLPMLLLSRTTAAAHAAYDAYMELIRDQEKYQPVLDTLSSMMRFLIEHHDFDQPTELSFDGMHERWDAFTALMARIGPQLRQRSELLDQAYRDVSRLSEQLGEMHGALEAVASSAAAVDAGSSRADAEVPCNAVRGRAFVPLTYLCACSPPSSAFTARATSWQHMCQPW